MTSSSTSQQTAGGMAPNSLFYGCENQVKQVYPGQMDGQPGISLLMGRTDARQLGNQNILPVPMVYGVSCSCF